LFYTCECVILKLVEVTLRKGSEKKENSGVDDPKWYTLYTYMEMSQ
jgi:hypothetical protein